MQYRWIYPKEDKALKQNIIKEFNVHPTVADILVSRNFHDMSEIHEFLYGKLPDLFDPFLFFDMDLAVQRCLKAIKNRERILIYGDNDVDGMTAAALLFDFFEKVGANVYFEVPSLNALKKNLIGNALEICQRHQSSLLITVDCGITAAEEIQRVTSHGIDVIITDHHEPTSKIPHCVATLNPKLIHSTYPNREITGVGVAFKLAHALTNELIERKIISSSKIQLKSYLDLVALGTIADLAPLRGENRILVRYGIKQMKKRKRVGLSKLFEISELENSEISPATIASKISPRLNSLGRISEPRKGVELLLSKNNAEAEKLAFELDLNNLKRKKIEKEAATDIEDELLNNPELLKDNAIVLQSTTWHPGIIAILSSRIAKETNRPTLILSIENGVGKGSMRTHPKFPLLPFLKENEDLLINYGGHNAAAGLTIEVEKIEEFTRRLKENAGEILIKDDLSPTLHLDANLPFKEVTFDLMESISLLEPFGSENPPPIFFSNASLLWPPKVVGKHHLKLFLEQDERQLFAMAFGQAQRKCELTQMPPLHLAFIPHVSTFQNKPSIQFQVKDFKTK